MLFVFGDSHSRYFARSGFLRDELPEFPLNNVDIRWFAGATVSGFLKPKSRRMHRKVFQDVMQTSKPKHVIVSLGQVDAEVGFIYRSLDGSKQDFEPWFDAKMRQMLEVLTSFGVKVIMRDLNPSTLVTKARVRVYFRRQLRRDPEAVKLGLLNVENLFNPEVHGARNKLASDILHRTCRDYGVPVVTVRDLIEGTTPGLANDVFVPKMLDVHLIDTLGVRLAYQRRAAEILELDQ